MRSSYCATSSSRLGIVDLGVGGGQVTHVGERIADRRELPVEKRDEPRRGLGRVHGVAEPEVAMNDGRRRRLGKVALQPFGRLLDLGHLAGLVVLPQVGEAPQLALEVAGGLAEALEPVLERVESVDLGERVDELAGDRLSLLRVSSGAGSSVVMTSPSR